MVSDRWDPGIVSQSRIRWKVQGLRQEKGTDPISIRIGNLERGSLFDPSGSVEDKGEDYGEIKGRSRNDASGSGIEWRVEIYFGIKENISVCSSIPLLWTGMRRNESWFGVKGKSWFLTAAEATFFEMLTLVPLNQVHLYRWNQCSGCIFQTGQRESITYWIMKELFWRLIWVMKLLTDVLWKMGCLLTEIFKIFWSWDWNNYIACTLIIWYRRLIKSAFGIDFCHLFSQDGFVDWWWFWLWGWKEEWEHSNANHVISKQNRKTGSGVAKGWVNSGNNIFCYWRDIWIHEYGGFHHTRVLLAQKSRIKKNYEDIKLEL